jgi:hypothetical protein
MCMCVLVYVRNVQNVGGRVSRCFNIVRIGTSVDSATSLRNSTSSRQRVPTACTVAVCGGLIMAPLRAKITVMNMWTTERQREKTQPWRREDLSE